MPRTRKAAPGVDVRLALLDAAGELLLTEGADGMTTRRLAAMAGTTTQAIYTEFGGKEGIARAMYREGFARSKPTCEPYPKPPIRCTTSSSKGACTARRRSTARTSTT